MRILVVGTGYVGLVTGACFAEMGHRVICLDIDREKIEKLHQGILSFYEPGLAEMVQRNTQAERLLFTTDYEYGVTESFLCFIAVSTPPQPDGAADISYLQQAARAIGRYMDDYKIVINKSTVPVGSAHMVEEIIAEELSQREVDYLFDVVANPEFLKEGEAVNDFMKPDRIVIGTEKAHVAAIMEELYAPFNLNHDRMLCMDRLSAEMTKYAANAMLASRISFMNEMALICERVGADITHVRKGIGSDQRIGKAFLYAGVGYGGSCFPKDIQALKAIGRTADCPTPLLDAIEVVNTRQKEIMGEKIAGYFSTRGGLAHKTIAIWGLSFKPGTDDIREAPSLVLLRYLLSKQVYMRLYDPIAIPNTQKLFPPSPYLTWCTDEFAAAVGVDAIVLLTEWKQFRVVDFTRILAPGKECAFFDGRNQYLPDEMAHLGFDYISIGRTPAYSSLVCLY